MILQAKKKLFFTPYFIEKFPSKNIAKPGEKKPATLVISTYYCNSTTHTQAMLNFSILYIKNLLSLDICLY